MTRVLSIDWDYFCEEDPLLDINHRECDLFLEQMWAIRKFHAKMEKGKFVLVDGVPEIVERDFTKMLPFRGSERQVLDLPCLQSNYQIGIAESHVAILEMLGDKRGLDIVNIDAHHDLGYAEADDDYHFEMHNADCGNWGAYLIVSRRVNSFTQIYPAWRKKFREHGSRNTGIGWARKKLKTKMRVSNLPPCEVVSWDELDYVFLCRSGCWTPPDYDERFNTFCRMLGSEATLPVRDISANPEVKIA
jgi:hypothetical protein